MVLAAPLKNMASYPHHILALSTFIHIWLSWFILIQCTGFTRITVEKVRHVTIVYIVNKNA